MPEEAPRPRPLPRPLPEGTLGGILCSLSCNLRGQVVGLRRVSSCRVWRDRKCCFVKRVACERQKQLVDKIVGAAALRGNPPSAKTCVVAHRGILPPHMLPHLYIFGLAMSDLCMELGRTTIPLHDCHLCLQASAPTTEGTTSGISFTSGDIISSYLQPCMTGPITNATSES